jgi:hypothetical protein
MLPARENLTLSAAAQYVAARCRVSVAAARAAIKGALEDIALVATGRQGIYARSNITNFDWRHAAIDWDASSAMVRGRFVHPSWDEIELSRFQIDRWLQIAERRRAHRAASPSRNRQEPAPGGSGGAKPAGDTAIERSGKSAARRDPGEEAVIKFRIEQVYAAARRLCAKKGFVPELAVLAEELEGMGDYGADAIRHILAGTYKPAKDRGYGRFEWKPPRR